MVNIMASNKTSKDPKMWQTSKELQIGKAGEHLVCFDLIMQGHNAFLTEHGFPFDILIEKNGVIKRMQVKTCSKISSHTKSYMRYSFSLRHGRGGKHAPLKSDVEYYALVALDIKKIAYLHSAEAINKRGNVKTGIQFKTININYGRRRYSNGTIRKTDSGRYIEDYGKFNWEQDISQLAFKEI